MIRTARGNVRVNLGYDGRLMHKGQGRRLGGLLLKRRLDFKSDGLIFRRNLTRRQANNFLLGHLEAYLRVRRPLSYPIGLQLEPTFACQLDCPLCPRRAFTLPLKPHMEWDKYERLMKEVGPYLLAAALWRFGEPFLNRRLADYVGLANRYNILTSLSTNGQVLPNRVDFRALFKAGLDHLIISTDGASEATFEYFRKGGSLKALWDFTRAAVDAKRSLGLPNPVINVRVIATRKTEPEIEDVCAFAEEAGADVFTVKSLYLFRDSSASHPDLPANYELRSFQYRGPEGGAAYSKLPNLCRKPWSWPTVCHDGTLLMCECDDGHERVLGNVFEEGLFRSLWRGRLAGDFREGFPVRGKIAAPFCQRCRYKLDDNMIMVRILR